MPSIQIKDVPEETHAVLRARAKAAHQSLQEYLCTRLVEDASRPTVDELLDRVAERGHSRTLRGRVPMSAAVRALRDERARR